MIGIILSPLFSNFDIKFCFNYHNKLNKFAFLTKRNELNNDIKELNEQKTYYEKEISKDNIELEMIQSDSGLEKYAREKLFMKKDNEEIFLIEYDTILD